MNADFSNMTTSCPSHAVAQTTIANLRLRCRAHNQLEAERIFGAGFMEEKRRAAH
jgi:hypothetical protein